MISPNTNWHVIVAGIVVTIVDVVLLLAMKPSQETISTIGIVDGVLLGLLAHSGLLQAADAQRVEKIAESVSPQIASAVQSVEKNLTDLHIVSTANVAALHTAVAVQAAKSGFAIPAPLKVVEPLLPPISDERVSQVQNKPVKL